MPPRRRRVARHACGDPGRRRRARQRFSRPSTTSACRRSCGGGATAMRPRTVDRCAGCAELWKEPPRARGPVRTRSAWIGLGWKALVPPRAARRARGARRAAPCDGGCTLATPPLSRATAVHPSRPRRAGPARPITVGVAVCDARVLAGELPRRLADHGTAPQPLDVQPRDDACVLPQSVLPAPGCPRCCSAAALGVAGAPTKGGIDPADARRALTPRGASTRRPLRLAPRA